MSLRWSLTGAITLALLSGCGMFFGPHGYFRDRGDDYLKAQTIEPITIPGTMSGNSIGQLFVIPPVKDTGLASQQEFVVPRPASSDAMKEQRNEVKIQKLGDRNWIAVNATPDAVWPRVKDFLADRGLGPAMQDPARGVLETNWLALKQEEPTRDRYRLELVEGLRLNTTEILVREITIPEAQAIRLSSVEWPVQSSNPDRESWMVHELSAYLAKEETTQSSMLAQSIGSQQKRVELLSSPEQRLLLRADYARAWASVGGALNRDGFHVDSSEREQGRIIASYAPGRVDDDSQESSDDSSAFSRFKRIFDFSGNRKPDSSTDSKTYRVELLQTGSGDVEVRIKDASGQPLARQDTDALLRRIRNNLI